MPFRYVTDPSGKPIMPEVGNEHLNGVPATNSLKGMIDLIKADADKAFDDLEFADEVEGLENMKVNQP
jgi:hypothetical protein